MKHNKEGSVFETTFAHPTLYHGRKSNTPRAVTHSERERERDYSGKITPHRCANLGDPIGGPLHTLPRTKLLFFLTARLQASYTSDVTVANRCVHSR